MTTNYRNEISKRTIRTASQSGKHHGEGPSDGAQRNARIAADVADRKANSKNEKEKKIADRTADAEKRKKETLAMATKNSLTEAKHVFHVRMKSDDDRQYKMVDDKTLEPIGAKPKGVKLVLKVPAVDTREARNKVSRHLAKNYGVSAVKSIEYKGLEEQASPGTEARVKIKNVSRPDDPAPDSKDSKLVKTGEIKTKKIDEGRSMSINRNFGLPESLIAATRELLEKRNESANNVGKGKTVVDTDPETNDRDVNDDVTEKKSKKKLDPVGKENDDIDNDGDVDKSDKYLHNRRKAIKKSMKEEAEQIDELKKSTLGSYVTKVAKLAPDQVKTSRREGIVKASQKLRKIDREDSGVEEEIEEAIKPYVSYSGPRPDKSPSATVMAANEKPHKTFTKDEHGHDYKQKAVDYFKKNLKKLHSEEVESVDENTKGFATKTKVLNAIKDLSNEHKAKHPNDFFVAHHSAEKIGQRAGVSPDTVHKHMKLGVQGYKAKRIGGTMGYRYSGSDSTHDKTTNEEAEQIDEAIKIGSRVKIHAPGKDYHGIVGNVGEIDHGLHNKSEKRYTVDYNNRSKSVTVSKPQIKLHNEEFSNEELARLEEIASKFNVSEASTERGLEDHEPRIVSGVKGMKSTSFSKKFPHAKAMDKWMDSDDYGDHEVHRIEKA
jgi:hypothetical protein